MAAPAIMMSARSGFIAGSFFLSSKGREQRIGANFFRFFLVRVRAPPLPVFLKSLFAISAKLMIVPDDPHARLAPYSWIFGFNGRTLSASILFYLFVNVGFNGASPAFTDELCC